MSDPKPEHFQTIVIHVHPWTVLMADPWPLIRGTLEAREACGRCCDHKPKRFKPLDGMQTKSGG